MFKVTLNSEKRWQYEEYVYGGNIQIGNWSESFFASASFWSEMMYFSQWKNSLDSILNGANTTALITSMRDPKTASFITWWTLHRFDREVVIHHQLFFVQDSFRHLHVSEWVNFISPYYKTDEDGQLISEW
jgi:hypothetical protein